MRPGWLAAALLAGGAVSCDFDEAFQRYCEGNPSCPQLDAGAGPEANVDAAPETTGPPDALPDATLADGPVSLPDGRDAWGDGWPALPPPPTSCRQGNDCRPNEICHPLAGVCMSTCNTTDDCPAYLDTCAEITDRNGAPTGSSKVCQCGTATNCAGYANRFTCNPGDNLCERMCSTSQDCFDPQRVCDAESGLCRRATEGCLGNRDCPSPSLPRCDQATLRCSGCVDAADCANRPDGLTQCSSTGACAPP